MKHIGIWTAGHHDHADTRDPPWFLESKVPPIAAGFCIFSSIALISAACCSAAYEKGAKLVMSCMHRQHLLGTGTAILNETQKQG